MFSYIPHFKPVTAIIILAGIYLGAEAGFLCGSLSVLCSNFIFGQGPWTPFQMVAWGLIGFIAGILANPFKRYIWLLLLYGVISGIFYSLFMDILTVLWLDGGFTGKKYLAAITTSLPITATYVVSNVLFLFVLVKPLGKKIDRIKEKYGAITHLPPFMGILLVLGVLWTVTEIFHYNTAEDDTMAKRVSDLLSKIDLSTIMFFLGILMAVAVLQEVGVLTALGEGLNEAFAGNYYVINGIIGILSSIVDNVPLVAGCMGMYPVVAEGAMAVDGIFWQLLAYCAGVGGSMLIIGSAAGVVVMGLEKITFGWYMKKITWIAFVGYLAGILVYWLQRMLLF